MQDKTSAILALVIVLFLVYLSRSGKLTRIKTSISSPAPESVPSSSDPNAPPAPGEEDEATRRINEILRGRIGNLGHGTGGG